MTKKLDLDKNFKCFPTLFVCWSKNFNKQHSYMDRNGIPLAFATWFEKEDAAFKSRKGSGTSWSGKDREEKFIDNKPVAGFKFVGFDSRYSTQNKWVEIEDPRGFVLQITVENVVTLLMETTVQNGVIQDECVWVRFGGTNYLISAKNPNYIPEAPELKLTDLKPGDIFRGSSFDGNTDFIYLGEFYINSIEYDRELVDEYGWRYNRYREEDMVPYVVKKKLNKAEKVHLYGFQNHDRFEYFYNKSKKITKIVGHEDHTKYLVDFTETFVDLYGREYTTTAAGVKVSSTRYNSSRWWKLYNTREQAVSDQEFFDKFDALVHGEVKYQWGKNGYSNDWCKL